MEGYKVRNRNGEYFVDWSEKIPVFNKDIMLGKIFSKIEAANLVKLLLDENICCCEAVCMDDMRKESYFEELHNAKTIEDMAKLLSEITWQCSDCSSDGQECCQQCLCDILKQSINNGTNN